MGVDVHVLHFLRFARKTQEFGKVATIGRQTLILSRSRLASLLNSKRGEYFAPYCEDLLMKYFGATKVESFDNSDYEGATHIVDMNKPLTIHNRYDTIIDGGSIEHVYNVTQALTNVSQICSEGGQILHILPANNFCGHGFWQFSPDLFFSLYSESNGYRKTQVFLADLADERFWYEVTKPDNGEVVNVTSSTPVYALVRTEKTGAFSHDNVQQSNYVYAWSRNKETSLSPSPMLSAKLRLKAAIKASALQPAALTLYQKWQSLRAPTTALSARNPHLTRLAVSSLV
jgi:hypothetical protein